MVVYDTRAVESNASFRNRNQDGNEEVEEVDEESS